MSEQADHGNRNDDTGGVDDEGDGLRTALCQAAAEVIIEKGVGSFSLREVARRAGVSHAAPGYHFGDLRGLMTVLATQGLRKLHEEMAAAVAGEGDPIRRLDAIGRAYVRVALAYPAHTEVVWREDLLNPDDPVYLEAGLASFAVLEEVIRSIAAAHNPDLVVGDAARLCWSAIQGLVVLRPKLVRMDAIDGVEPRSAEDLVGRFTNLLVAGMVAQPPVGGSPAEASQRS